MASKYSLANDDSDDERDRNPNGPPTRNLTSAALFIAMLFGTKQIPYAVMGGFNLRLRGSTRPTRDVDMCLQTNMKAIWDLVTPEARLIIPDTRNVSGVIKAFVRTGPGYDDCPEKHNVEFDLIEAGITLPCIKTMLPGTYFYGIMSHNGSPRSIASERAPLRFLNSATGQQMAFQGLNVRYMLKSKLNACSSRGATRDFTDILFLIRDLS